MKKILLYIFIFSLVAAVIYFNAVNVLEENRATIEKQEISTEFFDRFSDKDAIDIENNIREAEKQRFEQFGGSTQKQIEQTLEQLKKGEISLRHIFADTFFAGDSLMNGLEIYGVLDANNLATQVSATLYHLSDNISRIVAANPAELILHYGINMISTESNQLKSFISDYEDIIEELKNKLDGTRIIISGIFPVDTTIATDASFKLIDEYNEALKKMCEEAGVEFLDSKNAFEGVDYYGGDGIHLSSEFYSEVWLPFVVENKGIIG